MTVGWWCLSPKTELVATQQPSPWFPLPADVFAWPLPEWNLGAKPTTMELIGADSTCQDIGDLYWDVYKLWRLPRRGLCEEATDECLHKVVLDSIKECLWLKWPSTQSEVEQKQLPANTAQPDPLYRVCCCESQCVQVVCCHKTRLIWGNDGPSEEHPLMSPGSSCNPWRKDGKDEPLHQPQMLD